MSELTNIELMEWLAKGNGIAKNENSSLCLDTIGTCSEDKFNEPIREQIRIRKWGDAEWHIPTREYLGMK